MPRTPFRSSRTSLFTGLGILALGAASGCHGAARPSATVSPTTSASGVEAREKRVVATGLIQDLTPPPAPPVKWLGLIGEYGPDSAVRIVLERGGQLVVYTTKGNDLVLAETSDDSFTGGGERLKFTRGSAGRATQLAIGDRVLGRRQVGPESGNQLLVTPVRPIAELRREAMAATPPVENREFRPSDLVELTKLDPTIKLEIRYATSNNLFGTPFYSEARAFLQRPAAEAVVRVNAKLAPMGLGILVHDGYRPWYVTKMFWDASPLDKRIFVANPAEGSRHNRGAAVDLTLYDRATGAPIEMVSTYDETSQRAYPNYPGGTTRQRWYRDLLRGMMERERFSVYEAEWWHFDYADFRLYPIGNVAFDKITFR